MKPFKFFTKQKDFNIHIQDIAMFRVYTYNDIEPELYYKMQDLVAPYIGLPNTEENRIEMMNKLAPYFIKIESIYSEDEVV